MNDLDELGGYAYSGHSVLMGKVKRPWQDTANVLGMFGEKLGAARRAYRAFVEKGIAQGKRADLTGGNFVGRVLASAEEGMEKWYALRSRGFDLERVALRVSQVLKVRPKEVGPKGNIGGSWRPEDYCATGQSGNWGYPCLAWRENSRYRFHLSVNLSLGVAGLPRKSNSIW